MLNDRAYAYKSVGPQEERARQPRGDAADIDVDNRSGLADADEVKRPRAFLFQKWAELGSWAMCWYCKSLQMRSYAAQAISAMTPWITKSQCKRCQSTRHAVVPLPQNVPEALRDLPAHVLEALRLSKKKLPRPLEIDVGHEKRYSNGYRVKTTMTRFRWQRYSVRDNIAYLTQACDRQLAREALDYLLNSKNSSYERFYDMHKDFLRRQGSNASSSKRLRHLRFIEEVFLFLFLFVLCYLFFNISNRSATKGRH